jgi:hypothetical protein
MAFVLLYYPIQKSGIETGLSTILPLHTHRNQNSAETRRQQTRLPNTTIPQQQLCNNASRILGRRAVENKGLIQREAACVDVLNLEGFGSCHGAISQPFQRLPGDTEGNYGIRRVLGITG